MQREEWLARQVSEKEGAEATGDAQCLVWDVAAPKGAPSETGLHALSGGRPRVRVGSSVSGSQWRGMAGGLERSTLRGR